MTVIVDYILHSIGKSHKRSQFPREAIQFFFSPSGQESWKSQKSSHGSNKIFLNEV